MYRIDSHVHIVGNGSSGSGCFLNLKGLRALQARYMLYSLGLEQSALFGELDELYAQRLLKMVRGSSFDKIVILANDHVYDDRGSALPDAGGFYTPNDYVLSLASEYEEFIPAFSIHPARRDALSELEKAIRHGVRIIKILPPCQNINCLDSRFEPFFRMMSEAKMLLLSHTGGELSLPVYRPEYSSPEILKLALDQGVTVIAAHGATNALFDKNYFELLVKMFASYPNLYADNSALNSPLRSKHLRSCMKHSSRFIHGSDLPIPVSGLWAFGRGLVDRSTYWSWERNDNVLERDFQLKLAMGFPEECRTRLCGLASLT